MLLILLRQSVVTIGWIVAYPVYFRLFASR